MIVYIRKLRKEEGSVALIVLIAVVSSKARCLLTLISGQQQSSSLTLFEYAKTVIRSRTNTPYYY